MRNPIQSVSHEVIYQNKWFSVVSHRTVMPDSGFSSEYFVVHTNGGTDKSVLLIVVEDGFIYLVRQFRFPTGRWELEVPGGGVEVGSTSLETAKIELRQELGMVADSLLEIGCFHPWGSRSPELCSVVLATGLRVIGQELEASERGLSLVKMRTDDLYRLIDGECTANVTFDGVTLAALGIARHRIFS